MDNYVVSDRSKSATPNQTQGASSAPREAPVSKKDWPKRPCSGSGAAFRDPKIRMWGGNRTSKWSSQPRPEFVEDSLNHSYKLSVEAGAIIICNCMHKVCSRGADRQSPLCHSPLPGLSQRRKLPQQGQLLARKPSSIVICVYRSLSRHHLFDIIVLFD